MRRILLGFFAIFLLLGAWFCKEIIESWFFGEVLGVIKPQWSWVVEYGPPATLLILAIWLFWPQIKSRVFKQYIEISTGDSSPYANSWCGAYSMAWEVNLGVQNSGPIALTNCKISVIYQNVSCVVKDNFTLNPGEKIYLKIATHDGNSDPHGLLRMNYPIGHKLSNGEWVIHIDGEETILIEATAAESIKESIKYILYFDTVVSQRFVACGL